MHRSREQQVLLRGTKHLNFSMCFSGDLKKGEATLQALTKDIIPQQTPMQDKESQYSEWAVQHTPVDTIILALVFLEKHSASQFLQVSEEHKEGRCAYLMGWFHQTARVS